MDYVLLRSDEAMREHERRVNLAEKSRSVHMIVQQARAQRQLHRAIEQFLRVDGDPKHVIDLVPGQTPYARQETFVSSPTGGCCAPTS